MPQGEKGALFDFKKNRKLQVGIGAGLIVIIAAVIGGYFLFSQTDKTGKAVQESGDSELSVAARKVDGALVEKGRENFLPVTVMIENLSSVRPQAGLQAANVVYEALAEGGITRFLVIYASGDEMSEIGPVRSARPYFLDWAAEYHGLYAHAGGSPEALGSIPEYPFQDLDQINGQQNYFWRKKEVPIMEHSLFTSSQLLSFAVRDKELPENGDFESWVFKDEAEKSARPPEEKKISIDYSTYSYKVDYVYNSEKNVYLRFNGGEEHLDSLSKEQISVKNVIVQYLKTSLVDASRLGMETVGDGGALIFRDGLMIQGTWQKESRDSRTKFLDEQGQEIPLNRGNIWIEAVPTDRNVTYE